MNELFYFDDNWKNIGVKLSGGADSSILYYAVCNYFKDRTDVNIYPMTLDTEFKPWYSEGAKKIIDKVTQLTGKSPAKHIIKYSNKHKDRDTVNFYTEEQVEMSRNTIKQYRLDVVYSGLTSNPSKEDISEAVIKKYGDDKITNIALGYIKGADPKRELGSEVYENVSVSNGKISNSKFSNIRPFIHADKKLVYDVYKYFGMLEELYPLTYSCETRYQEHRFNIKEQHDWKHCGYCFFCAERLYAFGKLE
jgi:tRNA(Ile)-lysidine synthase TilS/MesJ|tara:strand:+ start:20562 stop:21311 length:750 start_codon:yes stop_codon:yes gene_type:complete